MACNIDLYRRPDLLSGVRTLLDNLKTQVRIVEGFEHAKSRLDTTEHLDGNTLAKCQVFVRYINESVPESNFYSEVSKLSLEELAFCSISFEERRLKPIVDTFKALHVRTYMKSQRISCLKRSEIFKRLRFHCRNQECQFTKLYSALDTDDSSGGLAERPDSPPTTSAEAPESFDLGAASWENIIGVFGETVASALPQQQSSFSACVRSRYPRTIADAVISLDLASEQPWLRKLFPGHGIGAVVDNNLPILGPRITNAIEQSELRKWEKRNGFIERTNCVQLTYCLKLRTAYEDGVANILHSHEVSPPIYDY